MHAKEFKEKSCTLEHLRIRSEQTTANLQRAANWLSATIGNALKRWGCGPIVICDDDTKALDFLSKSFEQDGNFVSIRRVSELKAAMRYGLRPGILFIEYRIINGSDGMTFIRENDGILNFPVVVFTDTEEIKEADIEYLKSRRIPVRKKPENYGDWFQVMAESIKK